MLIELTSKGNFRKEGNYHRLDVEYIREGKKAKKTLVAINETKAVVKFIYQDANPGDWLEIELKKSDDGQYWNWVGATKGEAPAGGKSSFQTKGNYETPEERARKQVYIVKQSSIANALEFHKNDAKVTLEQVIKTADALVTYVFGSLEEKAEAPKPAHVAVDAEFEDDIPF